MIKIPQEIDYILTVLANYSDEITKIEYQKIYDPDDNSFTHFIKLYPDNIFDDSGIQELIKNLKKEYNINYPQNALVFLRENDWFTLDKPDFIFTRKLNINLKNTTYKDLSVSHCTKINSPDFKSLSFDQGNSFYSYNSSDQARITISNYKAA